MSVCGTGAQGFPRTAFLGSKAQPDWRDLSRLPHASAPPMKEAPARLAAASPTRRQAYLAPSCTRTSTSLSGNGISTVCPSPTRFRLGLGPTNPTWMYLPSEPLGIRWADFSSASRYSCRHSLSCPLHRQFPADFTADTTLPYRCRSRDRHRAASVRGLSPDTLSAQRHSTSELLRTLSRMAASKPTSWLSGRRHNLGHLAAILGP